MNMNNKLNSFSDQELIEELESRKKQTIKSLSRFDTIVNVIKSQYNTIVGFLQAGVNKKVGKLENGYDYTVTKIEGGEDNIFLIFYFPESGIYLRATGWLSSYNHPTVWDDELEEVKPIQKTITNYEKI